MQLVLFAVAAVAEARKLAVTAFEIARCQIVKNQAAVAQMALGQGCLDFGLRLAKEIERGVKLVLVHSPQLQHRPQRMRRGCFAQLTRRCQLGRGLDDPRHDHGQRQLREPWRETPQELVEAELLRHAQHGGHMAMRQRALDPKLLLGYDGRLALQHPAERVYLGVRPIGEIGERARLHLAAVAIALAQQNGRRGGAVGHPCHVHEIRMP